MHLAELSYFKAPTEHGKLQKTEDLQYDVGLNMMQEARWSFWLGTGYSACILNKT